MDELPDELLSNKISGFYRLKKSKDHPNPASGSEGDIVIYNSAFDSTSSLGQIVAHELAHQNYDELRETERRDYRHATGWHLELDPEGTIFWAGRKVGYVEDDGKNSHEEDFANNVEYYLFRPEKLKKITPTTFDWIRKHFGENFKLQRAKK